MQNFLFHNYWDAIEGSYETKTHKYFDNYVRTFYTTFYTNVSHPCTPKQLYVAISTSLPNIV